MRLCSLTRFFAAAMTTTAPLAFVACTTGNVEESTDPLAQPGAPGDDAGGSGATGIDNPGTGATEGGLPPDDAPPGVLPVVSPCAGKIGLYCGERLGLPADKLYRCNNSAPELAAACTGACVQYGEGSTDACPCPTGDGRFCGEKLGADGKNLYDCKGGRVTLAQECGIKCEAGAPDRCARCPVGNGLYCGRPLGREVNKLYDCKDGVLSVRQVCGGPCKEMPAGKDDTCGACPSGDGKYCGGPVGMDPNTLYMCKGGTFSVLEKCGSTCHVSPPKVEDYCVGGGGGVLSCSALQWWSSAITYGPYRIKNGGYTWWDTDLAVGAGTRIQLRHASKLVAAPITAWGWQPQFIDQVTGERFQFLHMQPGARYASSVGTVYPAGTIVGLSGGNTGDTGYPKYSTGSHLCLETIAAWRTAFPAGRDACK